MPNASSRNLPSRKELLDEVAETEERIVRAKALEQGELLMSAFREKAREAGVAVSGTGNETASSVAEAGAGASRATDAQGAEGGEGGEGIGAGGDVASAESAEECLAILEEAKQVYERRGFVRQAEEADRWGHGTVAHRALAWRFHVLDGSRGPSDTR